MNVTVITLRFGSIDTRYRPVRGGVAVTRFRAAFRVPPRTIRMVYADLHVHTTRSDGALDPDEVPAVARQAGLSAVAITDHERLQPSLSAPIVERDGVTVIYGVELRVEAPAGRVDLLGYGVDPTPALRETLDGIQRNRVERAGRIIDCVEDRLGVDLDLEPATGVGRPHVARAIADHPDTGIDYEGAFDRLIGGGDPCFVPREIPSFDRGVDLLRESCRLVALAHPLRYPDPEVAFALAADLDAIERNYTYDSAVDLGPVDEAIERHGLLATGGSDAHDRTSVGDAGLDEAAFERIRERIERPLRAERDH